MITTLDHHDLEKSRKALFIVSVATIVLSNAQITDGPIKISEFEFVLSQETLVFWFKVSVGYFLYIFAFRLVENENERAITIIEKHLQEVKSNEQDTSGTSLLYESQMLREKSNKLIFRKRSYFLATEALPPISVALLALTGTFNRFL